jgi:hypothetical protein
VRERLRTLCDAGRSVVLIDDGDWCDTEVTAGLPVTPFPEVDGHFGGFPASEAQAIAELHKAIDAGATDVVVGWPARWWFDHLPALREALTAGADEVLADELLDIYVRSPATASNPDPE